MNTTANRSSRDTPFQIKRRDTEIIETKEETIEEKEEEKLKFQNWNDFQIEAHNDIVIVNVNPPALKLYEKLDIEFSNNKILRYKYCGQIKGSTKEKASAEIILSPGFLQKSFVRTRISNGIEAERQSAGKYSLMNLTQNETAIIDFIVSTKSIINRIPFLILYSVTKLNDFIRVEITLVKNSTLQMKTMELNMQLKFSFPSKIDSMRFSLPPVKFKNREVVWKV